VGDRHFKFIKLGHFNAWTFFDLDIMGEFQKMDFRILAFWDKKWR